VEAELIVCNYSDQPEKQFNKQKDHDTARVEVSAGDDKMVEAEECCAIGSSRDVDARRAGRIAC
jgi:hypothetical protein